MTDTELIEELRWALDEETTGVWADDDLAARARSRARRRRTLRGLLATAKATLFTQHKDEHALKLLNEHVRPVHSYNPLVQIQESSDQLEETNA